MHAAHSGGSSSSAGEAVAAALLQGLSQPSATARLLAGLTVIHWAKASGTPAAANAVPGSVVQAILAALAVAGARRLGRLVCQEDSMQPMG